MAIYRQGVFGPYSGRVGNVIGTFWKGRAVLRIRAASHTDANTLAQQTQRLKFKVVASFIRLQEKLIRLGFSAYEKSLTPFNSAMKYNLENAISGTFPNLSLDLTKVKISIGDLENLENPALTSTTPATIKVDWTDNSGTGLAKDTDELLLSIVDPASNEVQIVAGNSFRVDETATVTLPTNWSGRTVTVIGLLKVKDVEQAENASDVSTSVTYGTVTIA